MGDLREGLEASHLFLHRFLGGVGLVELLQLEQSEAGGTFEQNVQDHVGELKL